MAKAPPSFNLYPGDLIKSCMEMSAEEFGAYIRLLCYQWEHGFVPASLDKLARICGIDRAEFDPIWETVGVRFEDDFTNNLEGNLEVKVKVQSRLREQREKDIETWLARRAGGAKGGRPSQRPEENGEKRKPRGLGQGSQNETSTEKGKGNKEGGFLAPFEIEKAFEGFWNHYPQKSSKKEARKAYEKTLRALSKKISAKSAAEKLQLAAEGYAAYLDQHPSPPKAKYAQGWLNSERYEDDYTEMLQAELDRTSRTTAKTFTQQRVENTGRAIEEFANGR